MLPLLYHAHHSRNLEDLPFWLSLAGEAGYPVLELGCGTGRVLLPLAKAGYRTVGLDHDLGMLNFLRANLDPTVQPAPLLVIADVSRFHLASRFPFVIFPCNTFSTLDEAQRRACLECTFRHLVPGGIFAISVPNPATLERSPDSAEADIEDEFIHPLTGNPVQVSSSWKRTKQQFTVTWIYDHLHPDGSVERLVTQVNHQRTSVETYEADFESTGFAISEIYGDYDRSSYHADASQLIFLLQLLLH
jgi:SAM-dependent methyltransferase